ncbi:MAG: glycoside hydrolase family 25 protein [Ruminococcus sp.]|jgi:GH25 family lysozyme M1 (1,4-beta-N-acetylmuramidase)|nr:glycoside hydrolase family 25 protein [Ruminococcus sp.]
MEKKLIDVSKHNGKINWKKVKADGIEGAIIRAGYGRVATQKDTCFESNYAGARAAGLIIGSYWYSYAISEATAKAEAEAFLSVIKGKCFDLPVYIDIEDQCQLKLTKAECTAIVNTFCEVMEKAGYFCGVYSFDSFFASHLSTDIPKRYSIWAARVENEKPSFVTTYDIWQYSWKGNIDGITGHVDMNICYKDFPAIMNEHGLNNYPKTETDTEVPQVPPDSDDTADEEAVEYTVTAYRHHVSEEEFTELVKSLTKLGLTVTKKPME